MTSHRWLDRHSWIERETTEGDVYGECTEWCKRDWGRFAPADGSLTAPGEGAIPPTPMGPSGSGGLGVAH